MKNNMIKILFLINNLQGRGAEKVLVNLCNNLDRNKYDITLMTVCNEGVCRETLRKDIKYRYFFDRHIPKIFVFFKLFSPGLLHKIFIREKYDIEAAYLQGACARIVSACPNKDTKLLSWIHSEKHNENEVSEYFKSFREAEKCYSKFHKILCVSEDVKKSWDRIFGFSEKTSVIYNVNETDIIKKAAKEETETDFSDKEFNIVSCGQICERKGFHHLAEIQNRLVKKGYKSHVYILGQGEFKNKIENYLKENSIEKTWTFLGYKTNPYVYIAKADLFVLMSEQEGFSTAVTEALLVGCPVLSTDVSGTRELLGKNGEYGIIIDIDDFESAYREITEFIDNPEKLSYYRAKAKERGKLFEKKEIIRQHEELFDSITGNKSV